MDIAGYLVDEVTDRELWRMHEGGVGMRSIPCADIKQGDVT
jgi:hypothetical protein